MGRVGPCGPCTEIFYDHGDHIPGGLPGTPEQDGDRFVEIWNLVFMQYAREEGEDGQIVEANLKKPGVDTGIGLERLAAVMQGVDDNYETDLFQPLIQTLAETVTCAQTHETMAAFKVVADHVRASAFLLADGVMPGNEGRSFVMRRLVRRACRYAQKLKPRRGEPLLSSLLNPVTEVMAGAYPELLTSRELAQKTLDAEEESFHALLQNTEPLIEEALAEHSSKTVFSGEKAFELYDTHGVPLDILEEELAAKGLKLDQKAFDAALQVQRERSQQACGFAVRQIYGVFRR